jgi:hypothetical protein
MFFLASIYEKETSLMTGPEKYVFDKLKENKMDWMPVSKYLFFYYFHNLIKLFNKRSLYFKNNLQNN